MSKHKTIGIIGGIGPEASASLYLKLINHCQEKYHAVQDSDYPPSIIYNLPLAGFTEKGIEDFELVEKQLIQAALSLEAHGADMLLIACNTVHFFADTLTKKLNIPLINIIEETACEAARLNLKSVGVLSSQSTLELGLYHKALAQLGVNVIDASLQQQALINDVILNVMSGRFNQTDKMTLKQIIMNMHQQGAEAVILGCTELPLAINQLDTDILLLDSLKIMVESALHKSIKLHTL